MDSRLLIIYSCLIAVWTKTLPKKEDFKDIAIDLSYLEKDLFQGPSKETGDRVAQWTPESGMNPEELGSYAEGDIASPKSLGKNALAATSFKWPGGIIPYMISPMFDNQQVNLIQEAMNDFHRYTCVRFIPRTGEQDYVRITAGYYGCQSMVGHLTGPQDVNLQIPGCVTLKGTVIHELMHAIGFLHEQSREDRDDYVRIQWNNIKYGATENFNKASSGSTNDFGVPYDYHSVMHYSSTAFTANGEPTLVPTRDPNVQIGQRSGFSQSDIKKIRAMYHCNMPKDKRQEITEREIDQIATYKRCMFGNLFCWNEKVKNPGENRRRSAFYENQQTVIGSLETQVTPTSVCLFGICLNDHSDQIEDKPREENKKKSVSRPNNKDNREKIKKKKKSNGKDKIDEFVEENKEEEEEEKEEVIWDYIYEDENEQHIENGKETEYEDPSNSIDEKIDYEDMERKEDEWRKAKNKNTRQKEKRKRPIKKGKEKKKSVKTELNQREKKYEKNNNCGILEFNCWSFSSSLSKIFSWG